MPVPMLATCRECRTLISCERNHAAGQTIFWHGEDSYEVNDEDIDGELGLQVKIIAWLSSLHD